MSALPPRAERLATYEAARHYLDVELVRLEPRRKAPAEKVETALAFNRALGDPQRAYPSVQVAGTSGKGSVCALIAASLSAAGIRTGLHISPYLQVFTEKTWIDGRLCSVEALHEALEVVRPVAERFRLDPEGPASVHGLASLGTSYVAFQRAGVELAVMETGVGGRFDLVQGLGRALSVITDLGLDHPQALGETIEQVAGHKAGIMESGVPCVAIKGAGWPVLAAEAAALGVELTPVVPEQVVSEATVAGGVTRAVLTLEALGTVPIELPSSAPYQLRNAALAGVALDRLAQDGWSLDAQALQAGFGERVLPGRFEWVCDRVVLDGAHNGQKLTALRAALGDRRLRVVLAASGQRAPQGLLEALAPHTERLYACQLELYGKSVVSSEALVAEARAQGLAADAWPSPEDALEAALKDAGTDGAVLVTGSLYLLGQLRNRWYPKEEVLLQGTSWPSAHA